MKFLILRMLTRSELGMFHEFRRLGKEGSKQRAVNFDGEVVDRVFPAARDADEIRMELRYATDDGTSVASQWLKRQAKNWRLEGNCPKDKIYSFVDPDCLFAMEVDSGTSPATGSWTVFAADDPTTKAILSNAESAGLAGASMIALHDEEGAQIRSLLNAVSPELFPRIGERIGKSNKERKSSMRNAVTDNGRLQLPPDPTRLADILGSVGHTMPAAVADLVDNSITHDATRIDITFGRPDGGHGRWMAIADNGSGMNEERLAEAMRIGGQSDYSEDSLGKYGFGLKGASWSQTRIFTVVTKEEGQPAIHMTWDAHDMGDWEVKREQLEPWEEEATKLKSRGTVVLWKDMKPPQSIVALKGLDPYSSEVAALERHLGLVFHRFLEGKVSGRKRIVITINNVPVTANNPVGHPLVTPYDLKSVKIPTESSEGRVQVQAFLLPTEDEIATHHSAEGPEATRLALDRIGLYGKRNESQGLYIYRHGRLIKWGGWAQMWETNDEKTKLARVVVDFDKTLDDVFKINISKQTVQLPQQLQAEIKKLADIARKDSQKKYRRPRQPEPQSQRGPAQGKGATGTAAPTASSGAGKGASGEGKADKTGNASTPKVAIRRVKTEKFLWKVSTGLTGGLEVQISEFDPALGELIEEIGGNQQAIASLARFLDRLDTVDAQRALLAQGATPSTKVG
ncbi:MAG: DNA mismatch repair protein [Burkholderiales bacterium RIFCSPHIGHO2_01_FULL_64_960]|nr:MAG: DNA mismatch repair protein [Burkholderiales bacterium RIFCSPHIGHO2_01_FULL_64_960]